MRLQPPSPTEADMKEISKVKPATIDYPSGWYVGASEEYMNIGGPFETREDAINEGRSDRCGDPFYICNAALYSWQAPSADVVMDAWIDDHDELWWEDGFSGFDGPKDAEVCAQEDLQTVLNAWFERHKGILPTPTAFCVNHSGEWIDQPIPGEGGRHD